MKKSIHIFAILLFLVPVLLAGCKKNDEPKETGHACLCWIGNLYAMSSGPVQYFIHSDHPSYKLNKIENGQAPTYPFSSVPNPPDGYS